MIFGLSVYLSVAIICAFLILSALAPSQYRDRFPFLLRGFISIGMGLGIASCIDFLCLLFYGLSRNIFLLSELSLISLLTICVCLKLKAAPEKTFCSRANRFSTGGVLEVYISTAFFLILILSITNYILIVGINPHGEWDALAIWDLKARFIFRSGVNWERAFSNHIKWSHPDYPLMLPLSIVRLWTYIGKEATVVPPLISGLFLFGTVGLLVTGITLFKGKSQGYSGGIVLLGIPFFLKLGTFLYADVPLAFFFLATVIIIQVYENKEQKEPALLIMSGITASLSAWTKNEGGLFIAVVILVFSGIRIYSRKSPLKEVGLFMLGSLPVLAVVICFKLLFALENDLISGMSLGIMVERLTDPSRYVTILAYFVKTISDFSDWNIFPILMALYLIFIAFCFRKKKRTQVLFAMLTVLAMGTGYLFVYVILSPNLVWQLDTSFQRLIIHLTPIMLFTCFLTVPRLNAACSPSIGVNDRE